jgi:D-alanine-D-alanine ligase
MARALKVALLFGGRSGEHEVSLRSAASVGPALAQRHEVIPLRIDQEGRWWLLPGPDTSAEGGTPVFLVPSPDERGQLRRLKDAAVATDPDVYFPLLHGPYGEDGTIQGLLELAAVPYVGSGVGASAVSMDKELMKAVFTAAGIPQTPHRVLRATPDAATVESVIGELGLPLFVKPANLGSSVGVSKVKTAAELPAALAEAFAYDVKVVLEAAVDAREVEVSVLGNERPEASRPGEIVPDREFYDYDSKYSADSRTELRIPAPLAAEEERTVRELGVRTFQAVDAAGYARVDFFLERRSGRVLVNEINTIPGFTSISMFPKMWEATGLSYPDLLDRLVQLGLERHQGRARLKTRYR